MLIALRADRAILRTLAGGLALLLTVAEQPAAIPELSVQHTAACVGRWFVRREAGVGVLATINQGAECRSKVRGTAQITGQFVVSPFTTQAPTVAVSVDAGAYSVRRLPRPTGGGLVRLTLASGLDPRAAHTVSIVADGIHESDPVWQQGAGLLLANLSVDPGGVIAPWAPPVRRVMWVGTSIFAGILARGNQGGSLPVNSAGSLSYPVLASRRLGAAAVVVGFGSVGVTQEGSGSVPVTLGSLSQFMAGQAVTPQGKLSAIVIVVAEGVNDAGATSGAYQSALGSIVKALNTRYPGVPLYLERSLNGAHAADTQAVAAALGARYVDTAGWGVTTTDGVHPDLAGHATAAEHWVALLGHPLQP